MIACIDIGGTHTRVALSKDGKVFATRNVFDTPQEPERALKAIVASIEKVEPKEKMSHIVFGVPGSLASDSTIISSPNLTHWQGFNIKSVFKKLYGIEPVVINDALLATFGEATYGAGKDYHRVGFITVSTGIGGGLVVGKGIEELTTGFEPGRQIIDSTHARTLEDLASGAGVLHETGKSPRDTTDPAFWDSKAHVLAIGLWNVIVEWSPDVLVVGGPMVLGSPRIDLAKTITYIKEIAHKGVILPPIVPALLGDDAGLRGALAYAEKSHV